MAEIVDVIKKLLLSDWNDVNFVIGSKCNYFHSQAPSSSSLISFEEVSLHISDHLCAFQLPFCSANPKDFIEVKFDTSTVDNLQGLHCYMNTLVNNNDDL